MTERQGAFTVSTRLLLTQEQRARLERLVIAQRIDLADFLSHIVAEAALTKLVLAARPTDIRIPTRLYLAPETREQIEQLTYAHRLDLADIVSQIVADYLDGLPADAPAPAPAPEAEPALRQKRIELARLRARRDAAGAFAPAWLNAYIAELEAELERQ